MTGAELLALLSLLDADALALPVFSEGCDCSEEAVGLTLDGNSIEVSRREYPGTLVVRP